MTYDEAIRVVDYAVHKALWLIVTVFVIIAVYKSIKSF